MGHSLLCLLGLFLLSTVKHGNTEELGVKPTLTADRLTIPAGGSVTLTCDVKHSADFEYGWFREPSFDSNQKIAVVGESKRELVTSEGGIYNCRGRIKGTNSITVESDSVIIQETGHGVNITVTANSTTIPAGGSVTLTCDAKNSTDLKYEWVRETSSAVKSTEAVGSDKVIKISKGGKYQCRGWRTDKNSLIAQSDPVIIQETVLVAVKLQHSWSQIFTGETITLRCEIQGGEGKVWKYEWTAPNTNSPPTSSEYRISRVSVSHSGDYRCRGSSDYLLTGWSDAFRLTVSSSKPRATLTAQSSVIPAGGSVTLSCSVEGSAGWKFDWFRRDSQFSGAQKIGAGTSEHTISISEGGIYYCRGGRGDPVFSTEDSSDVTIKEAISGFGCERSSFIVPFIIGLVSGIIVVLLLMCCYRKIKKPCCNSLTQSQSTNQSSASQQTANQNETQVYSSLLHGDLSVYESIRGSGNTGSADEYNNVTSGFQLEGLDKRSRHDGTEESSDYNNVNPESASGP